MLEGVGNLFRSMGQIIQPNEGDNGTNILLDERIEGPSCEPVAPLEDLEAEAATKRQSMFGDLTRIARQAVRRATLAITMLASTAPTIACNPVDVAEVVAPEGSLPVENGCGTYTHVRTPMGINFSTCPPEPPEKKPKQKPERKEVISSRSTHPRERRPGDEVGEARESFCDRSLSDNLDILDNINPLLNVEFWQEVFPYLELTTMADLAKTAINEITPAEENWVMDTLYDNAEQDSRTREYHIYGYQFPPNHRTYGGFTLEFIIKEDSQTISYAIRLFNEDDKLAEDFLLISHYSEVTYVSAATRPTGCGYPYFVSLHKNGDRENRFTQITDLPPDGELPVTSCIPGTEQPIDQYLDETCSDSGVNKMHSPGLVRLVDLFRRIEVPRPFFEDDNRAGYDPAKRYKGPFGNFDDPINTL